MISRLKEYWRRLAYYARRDKFDRELEAEMRFHLEMKARAQIQRGLSPETARWASQRQFGNATLLHERSREMWAFRWIDTLCQDVRYSIRQIRKSPVLASVIVLSMALSIGATTAVFSVVDTVLLKRLPVRAPEQLVLFGWKSGQNVAAHQLNGSISRDTETGQIACTSFSNQSVEQMREASQTLSDLVAFAPIHRLNVGAESHADAANGQCVSGNYYEALGVGAFRGRLLTDDDNRPGADPVGVVSYRYWQEHFGSDSGLVGQSVFLNGVPFTIVGVAPAEFTGTLDAGTNPDITVPIAADARLRWKSEPAPGWRWWLRVMGRLKPGVTYEQARANLESAFQRSALQGHEAFRAKNPGRGRADVDTPSLSVESGSRGLTGAREEYSKQLLILIGVAALMLLIACANTANLLLARSGARQKELAVRVALGAGRTRLIRQLLTESIVLSVVGGLFGAILANWGKDIVAGLSQWNGPLEVQPKLDLRVLGFTAAIAVVTGIVFGIAPALKAIRVNVGSALKQSRSGQVAESGRFVTGKVLVVFQVGMSLMLLVGAGLFLATLRNLKEVNYGFDSSNLLLFSIDPTLNGYKPEKAADLYEQIAQRIETLPGVRSATISEVALLSGNSDATSGLIVPGSKTAPDEDTFIYVHNVRQNFLQTMGIPVLLGRGFDSRDGGNAPKVAIVNQAFASLFFPGESPVGQRFKWEKEDTADTEIVGLVRDARYDSLRKAAPPTLYRPFVQDATNVSQMFFEVRSMGDPMALVPGVRETVRSMDGSLAISDLKTQTREIDDLLVNERVFASFTSGLALLALLLASLGLYGVMSYNVSRRTHEIGIRMALGARPGGVLAQVMTDTMVLVAIGLVLGSAGSLAATRLVTSLLFGIRAADPLVISMAALVLLAVAALAGYIPARRASRVDPLLALRYE